MCPGPVDATVDGWVNHYRAVAGPAVYNGAAQSTGGPYP